ncbi:MAG: hypothetical protein GX621_00290 [Pirellulaceae bacterium]|nr:hypothetical protein [Pirellulaceae bacterium]
MAGETAGDNIPQTAPTPADSNPNTNPKGIPVTRNILMNSFAHITRLPFSSRQMLLFSDVKSPHFREDSPRRQSVISATNPQEEPTADFQDFS